MHLPKYLQKYLKKAEGLIEDGQVHDIEFSGPTYQVLVKDTEYFDGVWAFVQLDAKGDIKDSFCSCESSEEQVGCEHIAAAFLRIYNGRQRPLHLRFRVSLWNQLCFLYLEKLGDRPKIHHASSSGEFSCIDAARETVFSVKALTTEADETLKKIIEERQEETEATSLKFSNLTAEDLDRWRQGKPSLQLRYELSFWNDLAKWLMVMQDARKPYNITFDYSEEGIPNRISVSFPDLEASFALAEHDLESIIPTLTTVNSPLSVYTTQREAIQKIVYDRNEAILKVDLKSDYKNDNSMEDALKQKRTFGGWEYIPGDGFYAVDQHHILARPNISGKRLSDVLNTHGHIIKKLLVGDKLTEEPVQVSYALSFDASWNLHVVMYLFEPGDLSRGFSRCFGDWVYHDGQGFYHIEGRLFDETETIIPVEDVQSFIMKHRSWLNTLEGFETHLTSLEVRFVYEISPTGSIIFRRSVLFKGSEVESKDFGSWVYIVGQGFYSKVISHVSLPINPGIPIAAEQVPLFIRANREELKHVPHFLMQTCPVQSARLQILLTEEGTIELKPLYEVYTPYKEASLKFYEDFVYVPQEGFYELPLNCRLPEEFHEEKSYRGKEIEEFIEHQLPLLEPHIGALDPRLVKPNHLQLQAEKISKEDREGRLVYALKLNYVSERGSVLATDVWQAAHQKKAFFFSDAGLLDLHAETLDWLHSLKKKQVDRRGNVIYLSTLEFLRLHALAQIELVPSKRKDYEESLACFKEVTELNIDENPDISMIKSTLRPYQESGLHWLWFLYLHDLSGLLCDDMGLGKTHQSMALIAAIYAFHAKYHPGKKLHFLVICPTSVIYHWQEKLESFLPDLRVCTFHGSNRSLQDFKQDYDILLTSYGIWRNEVKLLSDMPFELAIFDEIQVAKNFGSRIHKTLLQVDSRVRVGLTGTPIENQLRELKALFDLVLPKYMPGEIEYRERFVKPIEKEGDPAAKQLLTRIVKPFLLRRKKEDVLKDLPSKVEEIAHCDLLPEQLALYNEVLRQSHRKIIEELQDDKTPVPYIHIFALLSNLKQICNHPAVYHKDPAAYRDYQSGKWNLFVELLNEARNSGQKVVVFSQYLFMLDILENYLKEQEIEFAAIRGTTTRRGEEIKKFNEDPKCEVFLGSLQATGLGIDLTAASVVIHYDRWWNAAREDQATDRVHRIGQKRGVQVFKLVTKNTFEEKIDVLIAKKGKLMEEIVGSDDYGFVKKFSREELSEMLQYVEWK